MPERSCLVRMVFLAPFTMLQGCAAILGSKSTNVAALSEPPGAEVYLDGARVGVTPDTIAVESKKTHTVVLRKAGYKEDSCTLPSSVDGGWVILDVLLGGLVGIIVDAATNEWSELTKKSCNLVLSPTDPSQAPAVVAVTPPSQGQPPPPTPLAVQPFRSSAPGEDVSDVIKADRRSTVSDMIRIGLATTVEQGPVGILRVGVGARFSEQQGREYYFQQLSGLYSNWRAGERPLIIELWDGTGKIGEYSEGAFQTGPGFNTPLDCPENSSTGLCASPRSGAIPQAPPTPTAPEAAAPAMVPTPPPTTNQYASSSGTRERSGFHFGLGLGAGVFDTICEGCNSESETGFSGFLSIAGKIGDKTYIGLESTGWTEEAEDITSQAYSLMAHLTEYAGLESGLFVRAGLGLVGFRTEDDLTANGFGFLGRIGYELGTGGLVAAPYVGLVRTFGGAELKLDGEEVGFDFAISNVQFGISIGNR
jgi:hypothetical protein